MTSWPSRNARSSAERAVVAAAHAVKAMGGIVQLEPDDFQRFVQRIDDALVVCAETSIFGTRYQYVTGHRGLVFYAKSREPLRLGGRAEFIRAKRISMPSL